VSDPRSTERLDAIIEEVRDAATPARDWDSIEARLMKEVERDRATLLSETRGAGAGRRWQLVAGALAAAATLALVSRSSRDASFDAPPARPVTIAAGAMRASAGAGEVSVGGMVAEPGHALRLGDSITAKGATGYFERPGRVTWMLDGTASASVRVVSASESLVLALDEGAVEAQVTPVPAGEAFAVDVAVDGHVVRVAVHGTHLRVARVDSRVVVDLTEGVISIGRPPRSGSTFGSVISAPAHIELDVRDLDSIRVDRTPSAVRAAADVTAPSERRVELDPPPAPAAPGETPTTPAATGAVAAPTPPSSAAAEPLEAPPADPTVSVREAVRACAVARVRRSDVKVTLATSVRLHVRDDGSVESARFEPPLMPALQQCAAEAIYKARLLKTGDVVVSVEYTY
jgi:hypothetical protein